MLIEFSVANFLSFKEKATLSMVATNFKEFEESNVFEIDENISLTKSAVLYGANASGKSNLVSAMWAMDSFIRTSVQEINEGKIPWVKKFRLSEDTVSQPSHFEIVFAIEKTIYRYGFEVDENEVINEWLFATLKRKEENLFLRTKDTQIKFNEVLFSEGRDLKDKTRPNSLFLSVVTQFNGKISKDIMEWVTGMLHFDGTMPDGFFSHITRYQINKQKSLREAVEGLLSAADFGIKKIEVVSESDSNEKDISKIGKGVKIFTFHPKYDKNNQIVSEEQFEFNLESEGTKRFFSILGPALLILKNGGVLVVDELDSSIHSILIWRILGLFNSKNTNPNNAQLIFSTHDTTLLSKGNMRRDQMWFVEKNEFGASEIYSLADYKVRNDASFEKDYQIGRYGAVPNIKFTLEEIVEKFVSGESNASVG